MVKPDPSHAVAIRHLDPRGQKPGGCLRSALCGEDCHSITHTRQAVDNRARRVIEIRKCVQDDQVRLFANELAKQPPKCPCTPQCEPLHFSSPPKGSSPAIPSRGQPPLKSAISSLIIIWA